MRIGCLAFVLVGCGAQVGPTTAPSDAAADETDVAITEGPHCSTALPTTPFAATFSTTMTGDAGTATLSIQAYSPQGRVPGADVIVAMPVKSLDRKRTYYAAARGTLDEALSSTLLEMRDTYCGGHVKGAFSAAVGGLEGDVSIDLSEPSADVVVTIDGHTLLCRSGALDPLKIVAPSSEPMPADPIWVTGNRLIDPASLASITATPKRALGATSSDMELSVVPEVPFDPFHSVAIDLSGVRDVMGAPLGLGVLHTRALSASVADPTFASPPGDGAVIGAGATVADGRLRAASVETYDVVIGIGAIASPKKLHLKHRFDCPKGSTPSTSSSFRLLSDAGAVIAVEVSCDTSPAETIVDLGAGRWAIEARSGRAQVGIGTPCWGPGGWSADPSTAYELDEFSYE
ncbi:MAG: hypothetical protein ACXVEE_03685 [Polyangiales bacterium]